MSRPAAARIALGLAALALGLSGVLVNLEPALISFPYENTGGFDPGPLFWAAFALVWAAGMASALPTFVVLVGIDAGLRTAIAGILVWDPDRAAELAHFHPGLHVLVNGATLLALWVGWALMVRGLAATELWGWRAVAAAGLAGGVTAGVLLAPDLVEALPLRS